MANLSNNKVYLLSRLCSLFIKTIFYEINSTIPFKGIAEHYAENIIIKRVSLIDGRSNGPMEVFHQNGQLRYQGIYKYGKRIGKVPEYFDENGELSSETRLTGRLIDLNEEVESEGFYTNGEIKYNNRGLSGWPSESNEFLSNTYYKNGQKEQSMQSNSDEFLANLYYENGQKQFSRWSKKDLRFSESYEEDGSLKFRSCTKPGGDILFEGHDKKDFDECMESVKEERNVHDKV